MLIGPAAELCWQFGVLFQRLGRDVGLLLPKCSSELHVVNKTKNNILLIIEKQIVYTTTYYESLIYILYPMQFACV